jgi:hypothetical protein
MLTGAQLLEDRMAEMQHSVVSLLQSSLGGGGGSRSEGRSRSGGGEIHSNLCTPVSLEEAHDLVHSD